MSNDRPSAKSLADDIVSQGTKLIGNTSDTDARAALLKDSGFLGGSGARDQQYRDQVQQAIKDSGVKSVEDRGNADIGISIYSAASDGEIEIVKAMPGQHHVGTYISDDLGDSKPMVPNFKEADVVLGKVTIWNNGDEVTEGK